MGLMSCLSCHLKLFRRARLHCVPRPEPAVMLPTRPGCFENREQGLDLARGLAHRGAGRLARSRRQRFWVEPATDEIGMRVHRDRPELHRALGSGIEPQPEHGTIRDREDAVRPLRPLIEKLLGSPVDGHPNLPRRCHPPVSQTITVPPDSTAAVTGIGFGMATQVPARSPSGAPHRVIVEADAAFMGHRVDTRRVAPWGSANSARTSCHGASASKAVADALIWRPVASSQLAWSRSILPDCSARLKAWI